MLQNQISPGEELLAYSGGTLPTLFLSKGVAVGLTNLRLIIQPIKKNNPDGDPWSIWLNYLESIELSGLFSRLKIKVTGGTLGINPNKGYWKKRGKQLAGVFSSISGSRSQETLDQARLKEQIEDFQELGLIQTALKVSQTADLEDKPDKDGELTLVEKLSNHQLALKVAAIFLFVNVLIAIFFSFFSMALALSGMFVSVVIDILIGVYLWRGQSNPWSGWAILRAGFGALVYGIAFASQGLYLDLMAQLSFCGAIILVLTSKNDRLGIYTAIGIYAIGYLGILAVTFILGLISAFTAF
jgi:hypothetical protein